MTAAIATVIACMPAYAATVVDLAPPGELRRIANTASKSASMMAALASLLKTDQSTNMDANGDGKPDALGDVRQLLKPLEYIQYANAVLDMIDAFMGPSGAPDPLKQLAERLDAQTEGLGFQLLQAVNDESTAKGRAALMTSKTAIETQMMIAADGNAMFHSLEAVNRALTASASQRAYSRLPDWIREAVGEPDHPNNQQYDWRLAVPTLMELISIRLSVLSAFDPVWMKNGLFKEEILKYRSALLEHYDKMTAGVRCGTYPPHDNIHVNGGMCIDIHTGAKSFDGLPRSDSEALRNRERSKRAVLGAMPLFEMRTMIDSLYTLANSWSGVFPTWGGMATVCKNLPEHVSDPDVVEHYQRNFCDRIDSAGQGVNAGPIFSGVGGGYCLDVRGNVGEAGTPLEIYECTPPYEETNPAQFFSYNPDTYEIKHVDSGLCVDVKGGSNRDKVPVQLWDCNGTEAQRWTFDAENRVLQNALNTVLDVQWGVGENNTPVWTWTRNGSDAQWWQ